MSRRTTALLCALILLAASAILALIQFSEPTAVQESATRRSAMLVETVTVRRGDHRPTIEAMGTVQPARDITLSPRISGRVIELAPGLEPGGFVAAGEALLRIDPADYDNQLAQREAELQQAEADLALELGRQDVAAQDYRLLDDSVAAPNASLVLREPQLQAARAAVRSAEAALQQSRLARERTTVEAPFDAHVLSRAVNVGSQVAPGDALARLVGTDVYWVVAAVPLSKLGQIPVTPRDDAPGAAVRIHHRAAWPDGVMRHGRVERQLGELSERTRMARLLITVRDPLARAPGAAAPPLIIGAYVETLIEGRVLEDVIRVPREYLRQDDTVWVMDDEDRLRIRDVTVAFQDARHAYVADGLSDGARVVTTPLSSVVDGAELRSEPASASPGDATRSTPGSR